MTKTERKRYAAVTEAAECPFLENLALRLVLEHYAVPNWQELVDRIMDDPELLAGVHLKFRGLDDKLARTPNPSVALDFLLGSLPRRRKPH